MATFKICVFPHQKRRDEKYPVSIRVYWEKKSAYIKTEYYVVIEQINQNKRKKIFELKDTAIIGELTDRIKLFEKAKVDILGMRIYTYSASELARYFEDLISNSEKKEEIDFIEFARGYIERETAKGRNVKRMKTSINALADYAGNSISIHDVTSKHLNGFVEHLQTERDVERVNQHGRSVKTINKPVSNTTIAGYTTDIRTIFNAAVDEYNDDEKGIITIRHYPFSKFKIPKTNQALKRNVSGEQIYKIYRCSELRISQDRAILARDVFMLSFMLVGANLKDLYYLKKKDYANGRITYKRAKTKDRRDDEALISIKVEKEAFKYLEKYKDNKGVYLFDFHKRYSTDHAFVANISIGLKRVAEVSKIKAPLSTYYARHSWATIARNKCGISKSDIDECLNHVDPNLKMADKYIEKDWSLIDRSNRSVLNYVLKSCNLRKVFVKKLASNQIKFARKCRKQKSDLF